MLNALKNAGIPAVEVCPEEFIGKTPRGENFHVKRASNAAGINYTLKIADVYFGARCTKENVIRTILSRKKPSFKRIIRVKVSFRDGDIIILSFKRFNFALKIVEILKKDNAIETINVKELVTNV